MLNWRDGQDLGEHRSGGRVVGVGGICKGTRNVVAGAGLLGPLSVV